MKTKMLSVMGLLGALAVSGYGTEVIGQAGLQIGGARANFGTRPLSPGFVPDPIRVPIVSGGNISARALNLGPGCTGFVTRQPDYIIRLTGMSRFLRIYVTAGTDTTLLVNRANGQWACNDDSFGGNNPSVDLANAGPGQYDVWVGSYQAGVQGRGNLNITELPSNHP